MLQSIVGDRCCGELPREVIDAWDEQSEGRVESVSRDVDQQTGVPSPAAAPAPAGVPLPRPLDAVPLLLASGSPRRRELLSGLGLQFEVSPAEVDESARPGEEPEQLVTRLSAAKADRGAAARPDALVIAADTVVVCDGEILGKPVDADENRAFLERLAGRGHLVYTGHCLRRGDRTAARVCRTEVTFRELSGAEIDRYVATGEGLDKAGGYAIQGRGAALVPRIEGCYFNVVGLSLAAVVDLARELGAVLV
jgi:septum formation protein